jgi:ABC-2 type transport system permease protein
MPPSPSNPSASVSADQDPRPTAVGSDLGRFWTLTITLAAMDFKLRFFGSTLGYLWTLMRPLLLFGVLYVVFTQVFRLGNRVDHYPAYLLMSIVFFSFFGEATTRGVTALVEREGLLRKVPFPRMAIPVSVTLNALFNLLMSLSAVAVFVFASGIRPRFAWFELPLLIGLAALFAAAVAMLLSALFIRHRDIKPIWEVGLQILFYVTPVLYVVTAVPERFKPVLLVNPLAVLLTQMRHAIIDPAAPSAAEFFGWWQLLIPAAVVVAAAVLAIGLFRHEIPVIAEKL